MKMSNKNKCKLILNMGIAGLQAGFTVYVSLAGNSYWPEYVAK